ncbi:Uncharacterised protein [Acinetobacter baumannii]|uniref:hypothetical protein n=1 Tax=Acinetobacter baumannii TaxID=470 RepID=UPI000DE63537|nr:hypothetical protein [Acinetobacter baumannii]MBP4545761.1 hypothetical protein [Acinetobacter baumannii]MBP4719564.1 hypothetical protein [Acinetobacter baumannii]MCJ9200788.1 hypothetical protein [Acinetobacter baumannii]MCJ9353819.1 hypothetical protein [Acinetobacter baumannii]SSO88626.1 Uncharacterised protein [Acinetobacter baumannii]
MSDCNKAGHQIDPLELFELFFSSITPEMTPMGIRSQGMKAIHHFWKQRFLNVFRGIPEDKGLDQFSDLPILWLSAWNHQQEKVEELEKEWLEMNQQHEQAVKECFDVNSENRKLQKRINKAKEIANELMQSVENYKLGELLEKVLNGDLDEVSKT